MKYRFLFLIICLGWLSNDRCFGQSTALFIDEYKRAYSVKQKESYFDSTLVYIPTVMNLGETNTWRKWKASDFHTRRTLFLGFLIPPILADTQALCLQTRERYIFPVGMLHYEEGDSNELIGPITHKTWYDEKVIAPLIDYLKANPIDYIFSIINVGYDKKNHDGLFWIIKNNKLYSLVFDVAKRSFIDIDADYFLEHYAHDDYFMTVGEK